MNIYEDDILGKGTPRKNIIEEMYNGLNDVRITEKRIKEKRANIVRANYGLLVI